MNKKPNKALFGNDVGARLGQGREKAPWQSWPVLKPVLRGTFSGRPGLRPGFRPPSHHVMLDSLGHSFFLSAHLASIFEARATEYSNQSPGNINTDKILVSAQSVWFPLNPQLDL